MDPRLKIVTLTALFSAGSAAVGFLFMAVPNVEGFTAMLFVGGWVLGLRYGSLSALIAGLLYFGLNPMGMFPPLLVAQILGSVPVGLAGGVLQKVAFDNWGNRVLLGGVAFSLTVWYDLLTNLAYPLTVGYDSNGIRAVLLAGIPFSLIHITVNILIFILVVPYLLKVVKRVQL